jgi:hypothetical protein
VTFEWRHLRAGETDHEMLWASVALALGVLFVAWRSLVEFPPVLCPFLAVTGLPCPTCGSTRALFAFIAGHPLEAIRHNPLTGTGLALSIPYLLYAAFVSVTGLPRLRVVPSTSVRRASRWTAWAAIAATWVFLIVDGR